MSAKATGVLAVIAGILAVVLWWLSREVVQVVPPELEVPVPGTIERVWTDTRLLMAATVSAGLAMVLATLALLRLADRPMGGSER